MITPPAERRAPQTASRSHGPSYLLCCSDSAVEYFAPRMTRPGLRDADDIVRCSGTDLQELDYIPWSTSLPSSVSFSVTFMRIYACRASSPSCSSRSSAHASSGPSSAGAFSLPFVLCPPRRLYDLSPCSRVPSCPAAISSERILADKTPQNIVSHNQASRLGRLPPAAPGRTRRRGVRAAR